MPRPQVSDYYRQKARAEGFASRAVYKLKAINEKYRFLRAGQRVLDLGCSPGSWLQYLSRVVGPRGLVLGVDVVPPSVPLTPPLDFVLGDIQSIDFGILRAKSLYFDVIVSDMAPKTSGIKAVDQERSLLLALRAWEIAAALLAEGGHFLVKVFEGPDTREVAARLQAAFRSWHRVKPPGSRPASKELYLLGLHRRPPGGSLEAVTEP